MASIDDLILRSTNPFDNLRSVNFWHKQKDPEPVVESIHQEAIAVIEATLDQVGRDHYTRTIILDGDSGSGKTYLLGRLKRAFNHKAFFAYIPPFPQSDYIWRHILRYTVDSLVQVPAGQKYSQLLLWLKNVLLTLKQRSLRDRLKENILDLLQTDRQQFIKRLKEIYKQVSPNSIYNADKFFGLLHDLTDAKLYSLACEWLRVDDLSEESLQALRLKSSIDTEQAAREILANFGRVALNTQPIVLCFDQLESIARLPDGTLDLQTLFNVNTKIHDEDTNFLIIISILTNTWEHYKTRIDQSHRARIDREVPLRLITLEQAASLWASRLNPMHRQASPHPDTVIYPLSGQYLEDYFPGGRTNPRDALRLGRDVFQEHKERLMQRTETNGLGQSADQLSSSASRQSEVAPAASSLDLPVAVQNGAYIDHSTNHSSGNGTTTPTADSDRLATFRLKWHDELTKVQESISRIRYFTSLELVESLKEVLLALGIERIKAPLLERTKFAGCSFGYEHSDRPESYGIVWTEDQGMNTFFYIMDACQRAVEQRACQTLILIRAETVGHGALKGHQLYRQIFTGVPHYHITPDLLSVQYLATYYNLVKDAREGDLVIGSQTVGLKQLQMLIQDSGLLNDCTLLQQLGVIHPADTAVPEDAQKPESASDLDPRLMRQLEEYLLSLVQTHPVIGLQTLLHHAQRQFPYIEIERVSQQVQRLCQSQQVQVLNPQAALEAQLVCWRPR
ncbi:MAG: ATP-binding protein [Synechococcales cyanobacterium C42_A2020_086]|jgi:hypothetical protein|nr:ATP-binding protein [Synechococcales cyanobacterium C42_A2020_086]